MSYVSHRIGETRIFDCIYDPNFILSGNRDIVRANSYAMSMSAPFRIQTRFNLLFSNLPQTSRLTYTKEDNPLPNLRLRAGEENCSDYKNLLFDVRGKRRPHFFYYPQNNTKIINLQILPDIPKKKRKDHQSQKLSQNKGCQTQYRESSAQTHPYQPDAIYVDGNAQDSEIIAAAKLITGFDEPGNFEAQIIERARRRRQWEKSLTKLSDLNQIDKYKTALEAFEWEQWLAREKEIEEYQNMRLEIVAILLAKRETSLQDNTVKKIENTTQRIENRRNQQLKKLEHEYKRKLRKLEKKHKNISTKYMKEDIVTAFTDPSSDLYGPQIRFGVNPNRRHFVSCRKKFEERLERLENSVKKPTVEQCPFAKINQLAEPKKPIKEYSSGFCSDNNLKNLYENLKFLRSQAVAGKSIGQPKCLNVKSIEELAEGSKTIIGVEKDYFAELDYQSLVYLQKIIKGRAIQNMLVVGKNQYKGLIEEIGSTFTLKAVKEMMGKTIEVENKRKLICLSRQQRMEKIFKNKDQIMLNVRKSMSTHIGWLFEFLEKELDRLYEQKKLHAICLLAEEERHRREAAEAGIRQLENKRRDECEKIYNDISSSTRDTITMFLEDVLIEESDLNSKKDARTKVRQIAKQVDLGADTGVTPIVSTSILTTPRGSVSGQQQLINDLAVSSIFPEVQRRLFLRKTEIRREKDLEAARKILYANVDSLFSAEKESKINETPQIVGEIVDELVKEAVSSINLQSLPSDHPGEIETMRIIRETLRSVIPTKQYRSSDQRIVSANVSEILHGVSEFTTDFTQCKIDAILSELYSRVVDYNLVHNLETMSDIEEEPQIDPRNSEISTNSQLSKTTTKSDESKSNKK